MTGRSLEVWTDDGRRCRSTPAAQERTRRVQQVDRAVAEGNPPVGRGDLIDVELFGSTHFLDSLFPGHGPAWAGAEASGHGQLAELPERGPDLFAEQLRLLPGGEVAALADLVEVGEGGIGAPGPCLRGPVDVVREDGDAHRDGDLRGLHRGCAGGAGPAVLPVQPSRRG